MSKHDWSFSAAAEKNKAPILEQLRKVLPVKPRVLEVASGTGQHAIHFASQWPEMTWQSSDRVLDQLDLVERLVDASLPNVEAPIVLDIAHWPNLRPKFDAVFSANCIHIASADLLPGYILGCAKSLKSGGLMLLYGPFKYHGRFTTDSNEQFDAHLRETTPDGGIRDFETVRDLAQNHGLSFVQDVSMPANNQFLVFEKA